MITIGRILFIFIQSQWFHCENIENNMGKNLVYGIIYYFRTRHGPGMEASTSFTIEQQDESEFMQASEKPFSDNATVCKCKSSKFMCDN
jgi:hypothetical protein